MKKILVLICLIVAVLMAFYFYMGKNESLVKYKTDRITRGNIVSTVTASGTVNAVTTVLVGTQVSGTIKTLFVDFNSPVRKGQPIAQIDPATFNSQVEQAKANLLAAKANLEKSEAALLESKRAYERNEALYQKNLVARSDLETSETNELSAKAQVSAARAQIAQSNAALSYAETNLKYTQIISPVDGIVVSRNVDVGQTVAASFQTPTLFNIAQDLTKMQIDTSVSEADIGKIKVSQPVEFSVDAYPDVVFKGAVFEIRNAPIIVQNVVTYDVVVKVDNGDLKLKPGMTANVSIIISSKKGVQRVSNAALRFSPAEFKKGGGDGGSSVWILDHEKPKRVKITTGISDGNFTELVSGDLSDGEEILVDLISKTKKQQSSSGPRMF